MGYFRILRISNSRRVQHLPLELNYITKDFDCMVQGDRYRLS